MKSTQYSEKTLDHFRNPRNVGSLEGENVAVGRVGNPVCGDLMEMYIAVEEDRIKDIRFRTFGCGSAVATSSMTTELVKGMTLDEAMKVTRGDVADALGGLPPIKMHCSNLAADALHDAIRNWRASREPAPSPPPPAPEAPVRGEEEFLGKGFHRRVDDRASLGGQRVLVVDRGAPSAELALELVPHAGRVVFLSSSRELAFPADLRQRLKASDVKILLESDLLEITGLGEVEKALVHDRVEDQDYHLAVDAVVDLAEPPPG